MSGFEQKNRLLQLLTPLEENRLLLKSFDGEEQMSGLFRYQLEMVSEDLDVPIDDIVGKPVSFGIKSRDRKQIRWWNGVVSRAQALPVEEHMGRYRAEVVPWLWFLTRTSNCAIHQNISVPEVAEKTFRKLGFDAFDNQLKSKYGPWEYLTQYRETAFAFISRLFEIEGIFYFFKHEKNRHTLVFADAPEAHKPTPGAERVRFQNVLGPGAHHNEDSVRDWQYHSVFTTGRYTHRDYNFLKPETTLHSEVPSKTRKTNASKFEFYDYPGEYEIHEDGESWAKLRMEEEETTDGFATASGDARHLQPGFRFELHSHDRRDQNRAWVVTNIRHAAKEGTFHAGRQVEPGQYRNEFRCSPSDVTLRPERRTPRHIMRGPQTAIVVGKKGEEIFTDEHGRVKVQFHWDREGKRDQDSSCWVRVAQPWAGKGYGAMFLPRVGQEVIVDFLESDPDRPIITGRVYNAVQTPPWELPKYKNYSGIKTHSTKDGSPDNFNELRFDDTKGQELFLEHAELNFQRTVEQDSRERVGRDEYIEVERNRREMVGGSEDLTVEQEVSHSYGKKYSLRVGDDAHEKAGGDFALEASKNIHLKAGSRIILDAGSGITFIGPNGHIDVSSSGVVIQGSLVYINSGIPHSGYGPGPNARIPDLPGLTNLGVKNHAAQSEKEAEYSSRSAARQTEAGGQALSQAASQWADAYQKSNGNKAEHRAAADTAAKTLPSQLSDLAKKLVDFGVNTGRKAGQTTKETGQTAKETGQATAQKANETVAELMDQVGKGAQKVQQTAFGLAQSVASSATEEAKKRAEQLESGMDAAAKAARDAAEEFQKAAAKAKEMAEGLKDPALEQGLAGLASGLRSLGEGLTRQ
jgi:type VI secretion system secreted protein VgrG